MHPSRYLLVMLSTLALGAAPAFADFDDPEDPTTKSTNIPDDQRSLAGTDASRDVLIRADEALNAISYTYYQWSGDLFDAGDGVYGTDCTGYVDRIIEDAHPGSYDDIAGGRTHLSADDYYNHLREISYGSSLGHWIRIEKLSSVKPGDVLVWKYKSSSTPSTGHVMIAASKPVRDDRWSNVYKIRITDSARSGHSSDNRTSGSGVGAGYLLFKVDSSSGRPYAYAWNLNGLWHTDAYIAIGRPK
jgi:hypothetical protein